MSCKRPTVCVRVAWRWGNVREQEKPEARKMLAVGDAESPASSAHFVGQFLKDTLRCWHRRCAKPTLEPWQFSL